MNSDRFSGDLTKFLQKALDVQLAEPDDQLTEASLKEIALKAGLTEDDWSKLSQELNGHLQKGANFLTFGNYAEAIIELEQAAAIAPYRADLLVDCGCAHSAFWRETGNRSSRERAEEWFRKSLKIDPGHARAAEHLSALKQAGPKTSGTVRKTLIAGLLALAGAASAWVFLPGSGETNHNPAAPSLESPPRIEASPGSDTSNPTQARDGDGAASSARPPLDGFLDIPWGSGTEEASMMLTKRTHSQYNPDESTRDRLCFVGGTFAGFEVNRFTLNFENGGFCSAQIQLEGRSKDHRNEFLTCKQMLTEKFGPPDRDEDDADVLESTWYFRLPDLPANLINLVGDERRSGVTVLYHSGSTRTKLSRQPAPPFKIPGGATEDL